MSKKGDYLSQEYGRMGNGSSLSHDSLDLYAWAECFRLGSDLKIALRKISTVFVWQVEGNSCGIPL